MSQSALPPAEALTLVPLADIARGGMGVVQLCRATNGRLQGRALAVKRLNPALEEEPEFVNMFLDETWITATINSPHVVRAEAWGRDEEGLFLAVELVEGVSLSRLLKESKEKHEPFAERTVANIASQVCAGLAAAHELRGENGAQLGLVHRDLTPGNILVSFEGMVKIADFGIAKAEERLTSTRIGMMKGKPAYMAPEQARGGGIDGRADLFALGVVMFELLTGKRPWGGANDLETLVNVTTKDAPRLSDLRKTSPMFVEIVARCLRKNPTERYANAAEIKAMLDGWRRERGFESDDLQSLAAFVQRNTQQQQQWFHGALTGELSGGGVAFQDLEARIDRGRKAITGGAVSSGVPSSPHGGYPSTPSVAGNGASFGTLPRPNEPDDEAKTQYVAQAPLPLPRATPYAPAAASSSTAPLTSTLMSESAPVPAASPAPAIPLLMGAAAPRPHAATMVQPSMASTSRHAATVMAPSDSAPRSLNSTMALSADDAAAMSMRLMQEAQANSARGSSPPGAMALSGTMLVASPLSVPPPALTDSRPSAIPAPPPPVARPKKGSGLLVVAVVIVLAAVATVGFLLTR